MSVPPRIRVTLAAAGTGKTTFLVDRAVAAISSGVPPERIVATTFTIPAAAELADRCRARLIAAGDAVAAAALAEARFGTTHAVCGRLVQAFAFELGLSPKLDVMSERAAAAAFTRSGEAAFGRHADRLDALGDAFGSAPGGWRRTVRRIVALARANGIGSDGLARSAARSLEELAGSFGTPGGSADGLDAALAGAVVGALDALSGTQVHPDTRAAATALRTARARTDAGERVPWPLWAELAGVGVAGRDGDLYGPVRRAAAAHAGHPRLREDVEAHVRQTFACAADAMESYADRKRALGLVDFEDQERLALDVLGRDDAAAFLREGIDLVLVDEIQDASPVEVAIYTALAHIAPASVWVGDLKQSVYAFRQADPVLVKAAVDAIAGDGTPDVLVRSRRARPALCDFVNAVFAPLFDAAGHDRASSRFAGHGLEPDPLTAGPLHVWPLSGRSNDRLDRALASAVAGLLAAPADWTVRDGPSIRPAEARDVAILCHRNDEVERVAAALAAEGVPVSFDRSDLEDRPEAGLLHAAVRWIADRSDRLALVEMARLAGDGEREAWLEALGAEDPDRALLGLLPFGGALEALRARRLGLTPVDVVDAILLETGILDVVASWGDAEGRLEVLDALRGRAARYAEERGGDVATLAGLADALAAEGERGRAAGGRGVTVTTWHRAKGGEWPIVVLSSLDRRDVPRLDEPVVETDGELDWERPLDGRWIRAWPAPYGRRTVGTPLRDAMAASAPGIRAADRRRAESVRLLYVGFTRARDHLVFPIASSNMPWLADLDLDQPRRFVLPSYGDRPLKVDGKDWKVAFRDPRTAPPAPRAAAPPFLPRVPRPAVHRPLRLRPSDAAAARLGEMREFVLGDRIALDGDPDMARVGEAFHAFVAVDGPAGSAREARADGILARWEVEAALSGSDLVLAADRLRAFLDARFAGWEWRHEVEVTSSVDGAIVSGRMDLLGERDRSFVIVDHKTFPGDRGGLQPRLESAAAQLELYADAVTIATGSACVGLFVHLPMLGRLYSTRWNGMS